VPHRPAPFPSRRRLFTLAGCRRHTLGDARGEGASRRARPGLASRGAGDHPVERSSATRGRMRTRRPPLSRMLKRPSRAVHTGRCARLPRSGTRGLAVVGRLVARLEPDHRHALVAGGQSVTMARLSRSKTWSGSSVWGKEGQTAAERSGRRIGPTRNRVSRWSVSLSVPRGSPAARPRYRPARGKQRPARVGLATTMGRPHRRLFRVSIRAGSARARNAELFGNLVAPPSPKMRTCASSSGR